MVSEAKFNVLQLQHYAYAFLRKTVELSGIEIICIREKPSDNRKAIRKFENRFKYFFYVG